MLVVSRKESQCIRVGESVVVTVIKISGGKVRIGIEAPSEILLLRGELEERPPRQSFAGRTAAQPPHLTAMSYSQ